MADLRDAATLVLVRENGLIFWARRAARAWLGGFHAFPGGALEPTDLLPEVTAIRETFEETGILLVPGAERVAAAILEKLRKDLLGGMPFADVLARAGLHPDTSLLHAAGRFVTPPFSPVRFDCRFFIARAGRADPELGDELTAGEWITPAAALARWSEDHAILAAPTKRALEALAGAGDLRGPGGIERAAAALEAASPGADWAPRIELRPGIFIFPVRTPTLPPATHTNCVIVGDGTRFVAIDPASPYDEERAALDRFIASLEAEGRRLDAILLTHRHHDHVSGAMHLAARTGAPILAHALVKEALEGTVEVGRTLADGEVIELPGDRPGSRARRLRCVLTEGHARGHLVYFEETSRTAIAGDMVAGVGFIVIDPPEGDMAVYLASLKRLRGLESALLIPSHGPPIGDPARKVDEYVEHRLARERKVMKAVLEHGARTVAEVVARAYDDTPLAMHPLAARSALAHLKKLVSEAMVPAHPDWS